MKKQNEKMTWYDVTLGQFLQLQDLLKIEDENERVISVAELLLGDSVTDLPITEFNKAIRKLDFLKEPIAEGMPPKKVTVNDRKYIIDGLIGNITTAQYVDYSNFGKTNDLCKMMAVFLIPEGHKYNDGYDMQQVFTDVSDLPIPIVQNTAFFFKRQLQTFMQIFQRYLIRQTKKAKITKQQKNAMIEIINKSMDMALSPIF